jgi:transcriptional regulator with XRE-family HTH domain
MMLYYVHRQHFEAKGGNILKHWLKTKREEKKLSQEQVASLCGISRQYYSFIEAGKRGCPVPTAKKIASALDFDWQRFYEANGV